MNRNFGKLVDGSVRYAPNNITVNGVTYAAPTAEQYLDAGWKSVDTARPPEKEGFYIRAVGWVELEHDIVGKWEYVAIEPTPRQFSKLKLYASLSAARLWEPLTAWLATENVEVDGVTLNALTAFNLAQELTDSHPLFAAMLAKAQAVLGVDEATVETILKAAEA